MKSSILTLAVVLIANIVFAGNPNNNNNKVTVINALDSVVFDLSKAVVIGNKVTFPVSILSDDTINALDFSLKYDTVKFAFDTIINLTNYITPFYFEAANRTIRFTSFSLPRYGNDTPLLSIRFTTFDSLPICGADLDSIKQFLNGDNCSIKVTNCLHDGISDINNDHLINIYPNPASEILNIEIPEKTIVQLFDINGRQVILQKKINSNQKQKINIENIANGIYMIKIYNDNFVSIKKVVINK